MDGVGQRLLNTLRDDLLDRLRNDRVSGSVALGGRVRVTGIVHRVGQLVLNTLGGLLLDLIGDDRVTRSVRFALTVFVLHLG